MPIDHVGFEFFVLDENVDLRKPPDDGVYIKVWTSHLIMKPSRVVAYIQEHKNAMKMLFKQKILVIFLAHNYCILFWSQIAGAGKVGYTNHPKINEFKNNVSQGSPTPLTTPPSRW